MAANCISQGKNVLYITLEMAEERIAERLDANMMDVSMQDLRDLSKSMYTDRIRKIQNKVDGSVHLDLGNKRNRKTKNAERKFVSTLFWGEGAGLQEECS